MDGGLQIRGVLQIRGAMDHGGCIWGVIWVREAAYQEATALGTPALSPEPGLKAAAVATLPSGEPHNLSPKTQ